MPSFTYIKNIQTLWQSNNSRKKINLFHQLIILSNEKDEYFLSQTSVSVVSTTRQESCFAVQKQVQLNYLTTGRYGRRKYQPMKINYYLPFLLQVI